MSNALTPTAQRLAVTRDAYNAAVKTRDDENERLRETVALLEKRIIKLQGHDSVYCQGLKSCAPSDKGTTE